MMLLSTAIGRSVARSLQNEPPGSQIKDRAAQRLYITYSTAPIDQRRGRGRVLRRGVRGWYGAVRVRTYRTWRGWCSLTRKAGDLFRFPTVTCEIWVLQKAYM